MALALPPVAADAQFYTVARTETSAVGEAHVKNGNGMEVEEKNSAEKDTVCFRKPVGNGIKKDKSRTTNRGNVDEKTPSKKNEPIERIKPIKRKDCGSSDALPELTLANLYDEIVRNGILFPKIVLAQAILETGWFRSHACRRKNNLFGLTNPKTGKYFEFGHWTESVKAYYSKVQYKYKGGDYLLWLRKIGYAEDPNYVRSVIKVLKMLSVTARKRGTKKGLHTTMYKDLHKMKWKVRIAFPYTPIQWRHCKSRCISPHHRRYNSNTMCHSCLYCICHRFPLCQGLPQSFYVAFE